MIDGLKTRWLEGTHELFSKLNDNGVVLDKLDALEMFARDGTWHTTFYANKVKSLEVWEVDGKWYESLKKNLPTAKIEIKDSIETLQEHDDLPKFNFIMMDNPMNTFGITEKSEENPYCEHFDVIRQIPKIIGNEAIVVFNVNRKPFDYEKYPSWQKRRQEFYGNVDTGNMSLEFLFEFYDKLFKQLGFEIVFRFNVVRVFYNDADMTHYFAYYLRKSEK